MTDNKLNKINIKNPMLNNFNKSINISNVNIDKVLVPEKKIDKGSKFFV